MAVNEQKMNAFMGQAVLDMGAAASTALVVLGDRLGLYEALDGAGWVSPGEVAQRTGTVERLVREWLCNQAAGGYVETDPSTGLFRLSEEQAAALAQDGSPVFLPGLCQVVASLYRDLDRLAGAFAGTGAMGWHEHDECLFTGTERFFRPGYAANLVPAWLPALEGVVGKLEAGAAVADVGCGHGASSLILAAAFPRTVVTGFDYHRQSIARARKLAADAGASATFEVASASQVTGTYDLITLFDCLHDMGDPVGVARHLRARLTPDGTLMLVEPMAADDLAGNLNPVGRLFYAASTGICTPASLSQEVGLALGAQAGEARLTTVLQEAGFTHVRRAAETPFNLVLEARP
jgi:SAM-dependent methyltransferase